jgi:hypothetical protein
MSHNISGTARIAAVTVPDDGEVAAASAPGIPASRVTLEESLVNLYDNVLAAQAGYNGYMDRREVEYSNGALRVGPYGRLVLADANGVFWTFDQLTPVVLTPTLVLNAWHFVYVETSTTGVRTYTVNQDEPDAQLLFSGVDPLKRYIGCFRTTSVVAVVIPSVYLNGRYRVINNTLSTLSLDLTGLSTTAISVTHGAPTTARTLHLYLDFITVPDVDQTQEFIFEDGSVIPTFVYDKFRYNAAAGVGMAYSAKIVLPIGRAILFKVRRGLTAFSHNYLQLIGFEE